MAKQAVAAEFDVAASVIWPAPKNEVYRVLAGLTAEGLIEQSAAGARNSRTYAITESGRAALADWIAAPTDYSLRYDPILKAVFLRGADPALPRRACAPILSSSKPNLPFCSKSKAASPRRISAATRAMWRSDFIVR